MNLVKKLCMQQGCRKGRHGMHKAVGSRKKLSMHECEEEQPKRVRTQHLIWSLTANTRHLLCTAHLHCSDI